MNGTKKQNMYPGRRYLYLALALIMIASTSLIPFHTSIVLAQDEDPELQLTNHLYLPFIGRNVIFSGEGNPNENPIPMLATTPGIGSVTLKFPWNETEQWTFNMGPHGRGNKPVCEKTPRSALDFGATVGSEVLAAATGIVKKVAEDNISGKYVILQHNTSFFTFYGHLSEQLVQSGQHVVQGEIIGKVGLTGSTLGAHLHFELLSNADSGAGIPRSIEGEYISGFQVTYLGCDVNNNSDGKLSKPGIAPLDTTKSAPPIPSDNLKNDGCSLPPGSGAFSSQLFVEAYDRNGGYANLGCTDGGTHWWTGNVIHDFLGSTDFGDAAIIHDEVADQHTNTIPAYVIHGDIWKKYIALGAGDSFLKAPTSDEYKNSGTNPQNSFEGGYITWNAFPWPSSGSGWRIEYRNGNNFTAGSTFTHYKLIPTDPNAKKLSYDWKNGSPGNGKYGVWSDHFSMKAFYKGSFNGGKYTFQVKGDDGVKLYVNGKTIIDKWNNPVPGTYTATYTFPATGQYQIILDFYEIGGNAYVSITWWKN